MPHEFAQALPRLVPLAHQPDDLIPKLGMGSEHTVIAVTVDAWRMDEQGEAFEELEGSEREGRSRVPLSQFGGAVPSPAPYASISMIFTIS